MTADPPLTLDPIRALKDAILVKTAEAIRAGFNASLLVDEKSRNGRLLERTQLVLVPLFAEFMRELGLTRFIARGYLYNLTAKGETPARQGIWFDDVPSARTYLDSADFREITDLSDYTHCETKRSTVILPVDPAGMAKIIAAADAYVAIGETRVTSRALIDGDYVLDRAFWTGDVLARAMAPYRLKRFRHTGHCFGQGMFCASWTHVYVRPESEIAERDGNLDGYRPLESYGA